jgi:ethanolamine utilization protein EutN
MKYSRFEELPVWNAAQELAANAYALARKPGFMRRRILRNQFKARRSQKAPSHRGRKLLLVQPLNLDGSDRGDAVIALDSVDAGEGDRVLLSTEGFSAMTSVGRPNSPIDSAVIGVIDSVELIEDVR